MRKYMSIAGISIKNALAYRANVTGRVIFYFVFIFIFFRSLTDSCKINGIVNAVRGVVDAVKEDTGLDCKYRKHHIRMIQSYTILMVQRSFNKMNLELMIAFYFALHDCTLAQQSRKKSLKKSNLLDQFLFLNKCESWLALTLGKGPHGSTS